MLVYEPIRRAKESTLGMDRCESHSRRRGLELVSGTLNAPRSGPQAHRAGSDLLPCTIVMQLVTGTNDGLTGTDDGLTGTNGELTFASSAIYDHLTTQDPYIACKIGDNGVPKHKCCTLHKEAAMLRARDVFGWRGRNDRAARHEKLVAIIDPAYSNLLRTATFPAAFPVTSNSFVSCSSSFHRFACL